MFQRADTLWLVFDTAAPIDVAPLNDDPSQTIRSVEVIPDAATHFAADAWNAVRKVDSNPPARWSWTDAPFLYPVHRDDAPRHGPGSRLNP